MDKYETVIARRRALMKRTKEFRPIWDTLSHNDKINLIYKVYGKPTGKRIVYYPSTILGNLRPVWENMNFWATWKMDQYLYQAMDVFKDAEF